MRWSAIAAIVILAAYHAMRLTAARCTGGGCDLYIPLSLLLPLAAIVMVAIAGIAGVAASRGGWRLAIGATLVLGVAGPPVALAIWRDAPDVLVPAATVLIVLCPACVLAYSFVRRPPAS